jgi:hypothetical protein
MLTPKPKIAYNEGNLVSLEVANGLEIKSTYRGWVSYIDSKYSRVVRTDTQRFELGGESNV